MLISDPREQYPKISDEMYEIWKANPSPTFRELIALNKGEPLIYIDLMKVVGWKERYTPPKDTWEYTGTVDADGQPYGFGRYMHNS